MDNEQIEFPSDVKNQEPAKCLGMEFDSDEARRNHFIDLLREKLKDPEFRKVEGFPIGEDEDILALSDPPYYTACPNPWLKDLVNEWDGEKPEKPLDYLYHREPFATDVSEGKNDPIYNAHTYYTKVPYKAIMRYLLHYTEPGDVVYDGFCGTGMTGVAAHMCGNRNAINSLGYKVEKDGSVMKLGEDENGKQKWFPFSKMGLRHALLTDLSSAATFVAYNYNTTNELKEIQQTANRVLKEVEQECGWMFETYHTDGKTKGKINYAVWSDVFVCPECTTEIVFWDVAVRIGEGKVDNDFKCPNCDQWLSKSPANSKKEGKQLPENRRPNSTKVERSWSSIYDKSIQKSIKIAKQVPVLISYSIGKSRYKKTPDENDLNLINKIDTFESPYWFPTYLIPKGDKTSDPFNVGITYVHNFYTKRNLFCLSSFWDKLPRKSKWIATSFLSRNLLKCNRYIVNSHNLNGRVNGPLTGTFYVPSESVEQSAINLFRDKIQKVGWEVKGNVISTSSATEVKLIPAGSIDYIFFDPPFGSNYMYSELSYIWESWLKVFTNNTLEAIENKTQGKTLEDYRKLMTRCFSEAYRVLKQGGWITIEFSNTKASVWNSIQIALSEAGFIIGNVSALDKKHGGIKAMTNPTNVKQDLIISAYKPNGGFEERFKIEASTENGVWDFIRTHLKYLTVLKTQAGEVVNIPERDPRILFDQVVAYYVRNGFAVPISSQEFQLGLMQRFSERDGMYFLPEQVAEYDKKKMLIGGRAIQQTIFVLDESSAINWLRNILQVKPQSFQDLNPQFMKEIGGWSKYEKPLELSILLEQNFLCYEGKGNVPDQIHSYLSTNWKDMRNLAKDDPILMEKAKNRWYVPDPNKAGDLEKLREKSLLREFEQYKESRKKLKLFRIEAVRAGFKKAWQERNYSTIISIAEKIPGTILEEDPKLLMWYDQAITRQGTI